MNFTDYIKRGTRNTLQFSNSPNLSFKGPTTLVYDNTELDSWHVGEFSSASYYITVEFDSNQKETMQVLVVARPDHASYTVFGRTSIQDELITLTASVTASKMALTANPASPEFAGATVIFTATYSETIKPLSTPTTVPPTSSGSAGMPTPSELFGTFSTISVPGHSSIVASYELDTLTFNHGVGIDILTNSVTKALTISSTINTFNTIEVAGNNSLSPLVTYDTLRFAAGTGILLSTDTGTNTLSISTSFPTATSSTLGVVRVDGTSIISNNGIISSVYNLPTATSSTLGGVKVDGSTITINNGIISSASEYVLPTASTVTLGGVKVDGSSITIAGGIISATSVALPPASSSILGGIKVGSGLAIDGNGILSTTSSSYSLPAASDAALGGIKVGNGLAINGSGVLSVTGASTYTLPVASTSVLGGVKSGSGVSIDSFGVISMSYSLPVATNLVTGGVMIDNSTITMNGSGQIVANFTITASSTSTLGGVIIPAVGASGITNTSGTIGLATASSSQLGGVKVGSGLAIDGSGTLTTAMYFDGGTAASVYGGLGLSSINAGGAA